MQQPQPTTRKPDGLSRVLPAWISNTTLVFWLCTIRGVLDGSGYQTCRHGRVRISVLWATAIWLLFGPTLAVAQEGPARFPTLLDSVAPGLLAEHEVAGLAIAYLHDRVPALTTGYGFVDPSSRRAMTASTPLNVASLSKAVTAWGVLGLVADGNLALGQPVNERLTRWRLSESDDRSHQVTIGRLLSHTAGVNVPSVPMVPLDQSNMTLETALSGGMDGTPVAMPVHTRVGHGVETERRPVGDPSPAASGSILISCVAGSHFVTAESPTLGKAR